MYFKNKIKKKNSHRSPENNIYLQLCNFFTKKLK